VANVAWTGIQSGIHVFKTSTVKITQ